MSSSTQRRTLWFLVPDHAGTAILTAPDGGLPRLDVELIDGETTVLGVRRAVLARWSLALPVVELLFDSQAAPDAASIDALIELAPPPPGWQPGDGTTWTPLASAQPSAPSGLSARVGQLLAERREHLDPDPRRARWSQPGWYARACGWIDEALGRAGWGAAATVEQVRHWGISAVMRASSDGGTAWFKAVFPGFHHEPAVTALLHHEVPGLAAPVLGVEEAQGWLLLADVGTTFVSSDLGGSRVAIERLVGAQRRFIGRAGDLLAAGCPHRPLRGLAAALDAVLRDPDVLPWISVTPQRAAALVGWVEAAAPSIDELAIPETLVHGDFHPGNVALVADEAVIIDWSDAAVTNPLIDVLTWIDWTSDDPELTSDVWEMFLDAWSGIVDAERFRGRREEFAALGAAYHTVSYAGIVAGLEPSQAWQIADGLTGHFAKLDAAVPR